MDWPTPKNVTKLQSFVGLVGYYRRSIEGLSKIACPITSIKKRRPNLIGMKNVRWVFKI